MMPSLAVSGDNNKSNHQVNGYQDDCHLRQIARDIARQEKFGERKDNHSKVQQERRVSQAANHLPEKLGLLPVIIRQKSERTIKPTTLLASFQQGQIEGRHRCSGAPECFAECAAAPNLLQEMLARP